MNDSAAIDAEVAELAARALRDALSRGLLPALTARRSAGGLVVSAANSAFRARSGLSEAAVAGRNLRDLVSAREEDQDALEDALDALDRAGMAKTALCLRASAGAEAQARILMLEARLAEAGAARVALLFPVMSLTQSQADEATIDTGYGAGDARPRPLVDLDVLGPILELTGVDRLRPAVDAFADCAQTLSAEIAAAGADGEALARAAHALKGAASNIGAARIAQIASAIERDGADEERLAALSLALEATGDAFDVIFTRGAGPAPRAS